MLRLAPLVFATGCSFIFSRDPSTIPPERPLACGGDAFLGAIDLIVGAPTLGAGIYGVATEDKGADDEIDLRYLLVPVLVVGAVYVASAVWGFRHESQCVQLARRRAGVM